MSDAPTVPPLVEELVAAIAELHAAHYREAGALQKTVSGATSAVARPGTLVVITVAIAGWAALNFALPAFGRAAPDPFPSPLLAAAVSTLALYLAAMILIAQRHDDALATRRDQLTLELAILSEQKSCSDQSISRSVRRLTQNPRGRRLFAGAGRGVRRPSPATSRIADPLAEGDGDAC